MTSKAGKELLDSVKVTTWDAVIQQRDDLVTIVDFCDAMARLEDVPRFMLEHAIFVCHDIAHVLLGAEPTDDWLDFKWLIGNRLIGELPYDVRRRMAEVIERAEAMCK